MEEFSTKDIYLASTLISIGHTNYVVRMDGKIAYFVFEYESSLDKTGLNVDVDMYWQGNLNVDPKLLFNSFKELKNRIYQ